jgi:chorismate-pyruvate lyase
MMTPSAHPILDDLLSLFPPADYLVAWEPIAADEVPAPYHQLLVHEHHMTVTVENYHHDLVDVRLLEVHHHGNDYARKILLTLHKTGRVVQFGLVRIRLEFCSPQVRAAILSRQAPLGRILIQHNVLRRIESRRFFRITPGPAMMSWFGLSEPTPTYGRTAVIHCDGQPAIELLEIVAPEPREEVRR